MSIRYDTYDEEPIWRRWNGESIRVCRADFDGDTNSPGPIIDAAWIYAPGVDPADDMAAPKHFGAWTPLRFLGDPTPSNCWRVKNVMRDTSAEHPAPAFPVWRLDDPDLMNRRIAEDRYAEGKRRGERIEPPMSTIARGTTGWGDDE